MDVKDDRAVYAAGRMAAAAHRPRSPLWLVILAQLIEAPMHPYRMHVLIKERGKDLIANVTNRNSIHQVIDGLLRQGLIAVHGTERDEKFPERTVYEITAAGKQTLGAWLHTILSTPAREYPDFPAALSFAMMLDPNDLRAQLEKRAAALEQRLAELEAPVEIPRLFLLENEYLAAITRAEIAWLHALCADLKSKKLNWTEAWLRRMAAKLGELSEEPGEPSRPKRRKAP